MATVDYSHIVAIARFEEFGDSSDLYAAEIVDVSGQLFAVVLEPETRRATGGSFDDAAFRAAVREWAAAEVGPASEYNGELPVYLVFDPSRDGTEEEVIRGA